MAKRKTPTESNAIESDLTVRFERIKSLLHQQGNVENTQKALDWLEHVLSPLGDEKQDTSDSTPALEPIQFTVVGMRYRGNHHFTLNDTLSLDPEPDNAHDPNAIRILLHDDGDITHAAYVSREDCPDVHMFLKALGTEPSYTLTLVEHFAQSAMFALSADKKE